MNRKNGKYVNLTLIMTPEERDAIKEAVAYVVPGTSMSEWVMSLVRTELIGRSAQRGSLIDPAIVRTAIKQEVMEAFKEVFVRGLKERDESK